MERSEQCCNPSRGASVKTVGEKEKPQNKQRARNQGDGMRCRVQVSNNQVGDGDQDRLQPAMLKIRLGI